MNIKAAFGVVKFTLTKYAPEIFLGVGVVGVGVSTVLACKATLKYEAILDHHNEVIEKIEEAKDLGEEGKVDYTLEEAKKDKVVLYSQTAVSFVKLYGPAATLFVASVGCILGSYRIMSKRNVALMAAYKVVEEAFTKYRGRVIKELGATKDAHFMYGTEENEEPKTFVDKDGNVTEVKGKEDIIPGANLSGFARLFAPEKSDQHGSWEGSTQWCPVHDYNLSFLSMKEAHFNDVLPAKGFITINEVYEELGFPPTTAGMVCGWKYKSENGDGYISFKPRVIDGNWAGGHDGSNIVLDFNIDGVIFDQNDARKELK